MLPTWIWLHSGEITELTNQSKSGLREWMT